MGWNLQLRKVILEKNNTKGNLIETITADENAYPQNGIKDGKWYVRKEIIEEPKKLVIKNSDGKLVSIASIYFKDSNSNISNIGKAYSDKELLWEKSINEPVYSDTGKSRYDFIVNAWNILKPNKNYKFVTNKADSEYAIVISGSYTTIKNNNIFTITKNCDMQIRNMNYSYYDIEIYEVKEEANITI